MEKSTADKLCKYKEALGCFGGVRQSTSFWDVVVVTARDETQKRIYERQISLKKERREIPHFVQYVVISDPPGVKVGSGGSTLHCLQELLGTVGADALNNFKVILIHAGGYSQRLPNQSVLGKVFLTLPCDQLPIQMLDALLMMYVDIPEKMNPGVFVVSSDVIFLYNSEGEWNFRGLGFTAIAHPAPVRVADNHGVFILEDMLNPWESYRKDPSSPSAMAKPKCFVHKQTVKSLQNKKAIIPGTDLAYVDLAFYFDTPTMHKLVKFYSENSPLQCEVDAYGDFLQALGPGATAKYCWETSSGKLARQQAVLREKLFNVLKETPLRVVIFHEAQFNHLGTIAEYLYHLCDNCILRRAYNFNIKSVHEERREGYGSCKVKTAEISSSEGYVLMQSVVHDTQSLSVGVKTVIEYCILERGVSIGRKCLLSNLHVPENSVIPENTFIHTVAVEIDHTIAYATCVFGKLL
jgi:fucose-1-phosphate guanylyltransferase